MMMMIMIVIMMTMMIMMTMITMMMTGRLGVKHQVTYLVMTMVMMSPFPTTNKTKTRQTSERKGFILVWVLQLSTLRSSGDSIFKGGKPHLDL